MKKKRRGERFITEIRAEEKLITVGLLCGKTEREELAQRLFRTGVVRVCAGERMSDAYPGMPHDGEYPLSRYTKTVCAEYTE